MNDVLRERLLRKLEVLSEEKAYQVLDYVEFLESKYAERPAGAAPFQKVAETLEDIVRNNVWANLARGEIALSMQVRLVESIEIADIARSCGYDCLYIDVEHSALTLRQSPRSCVISFERKFALPRL